MRLLKYCNVELQINEETKTVSVVVGTNSLATKNLDMLLDTLNIWHKLGYIELIGDQSKLIDIATGVELDIIS